MEQIILKLDQSLEPAKIVFQTIPNLKINFTQLKFIIENSIGISNPISIIQPFNLSPIEMMEIIDTIRPKIKIASIKNRISKLYQIIADSIVSENPDPSEY